MSKELKKISVLTYSGQLFQLLTSTSNQKSKFRVTPEPSLITSSFTKKILDERCLYGFLTKRYKVYWWPVLWEKSDGRPQKNLVGNLVCKKNRCKAQSNSRRSISVGRFWHFQFFAKLIKISHIKKEHRANNNLDLIICHNIYFRHYSTNGEKHFLIKMQRPKFSYFFLHSICEKEKIQKFAIVNISKKETDTRFRSVFCLLCGIHTIDLNAMGSRWSTVYYQQGREPFQPLLFM